MGLGGEVSCRRLGTRWRGTHHTTRTAASLCCRNAPTLIAADGMARRMATCLDVSDTAADTNGTVCSVYATAATSANVEGTEGGWGGAGGRVCVRAPHSP